MNLQVFTPNDSQMNEFLLNWHLEIKLAQGFDMNEIKQEQCEQYRKDDCYGCLYYDPEDQVCRFDK